MQHPIISNKDEFLAKVSHKDEIGVLVRDGYTVVAYNVAFPDTFDVPEALECRGIVFCNETGRVLRRPFHKFFNLNEKEHTQLPKLMNESIVSVTQKVDGAMIAPFICNNEIVWGTKRVAENFSEFLSGHPLTEDKNLRSFVVDCIFSGKTPIFEFHDPEFSPSKIVVQYDKAFMRLLAIRDMKTGVYEHRSGSLFKRAEDLGLDIVKSYDEDKETSLIEILKKVENLEGDEGVVVDLADVGQIKIKSPWYVKRHKIKEMFNHPHITAQLVLDLHSDVSVDDIYPYINEQDRAFFEKFSKDLHCLIDNIVKWAISVRMKYDSRKEFALSNDKSNPFSSIVFRIFDEPSEQKAFEAVISQLKNNIGRQIKFEQWCESARKL